MKKVLLLISCLCIAFISNAQTEIFNVAGGGAFPTNWVGTNNVTDEPIDRGSYYLVEEGSPSDVIETDVYDLSSYLSATFNVQIRSFGSGTHNALKVEISDDGGNTYNQVEITNVTTGSYVSITPINITSLTSQVKLKFSNNAATGRAIRMQNLVLDAVAPSCSSPSTQASNFNSSSIMTNSMDISFTRGDGDGGVLVVAKEGSAVDAAPTNGITYTADASFGNGDEIGTGNYVVYNGVANGTNINSGNIAISNLTEGTNYYFAIYEYNSTGVCYNLAELVGDATTTCTDPSSVTDVLATAGNGEVILSWTNPSNNCSFDGVVVFAREGSAVEAAVSKNNLDGLADESDFSTANNDWSAKSDANDVTDIAFVGTDNTNYAVYNGTGNSVTITGLTNGTVYHFRIITEGGATDWSTEVDANATPVDIPEIYISELSDANDFNNEFMELYNNTNSDINLTGYKIERLSSGGASEYIFDIGADEVSSGTGSEFIIPANGFLIIARGADSEADFDADHTAVSFPAAAAFNRGNSNLFFGTGRRWRLWANDGTANTADGTLLDDTNTGVANGDRDYQNTPGNWVNSTDVSATPGEFDVSQVLPVELLYFTAKANNNTAILTWATASEENNAYFDVQRSTDGINFETIGQVEGAGTTFDVQEYAFIDENPVNGVNYYRLRQVDIDGQFEYHKVASIMINSVAKDLQIYPNPTYGELNVVLPTTRLNIIEIIDLTGKIVRTFNSTDDGITTLDIADLVNGQYIIKVSNEQMISTSLFIKTR